MNLMSGLGKNKREFKRKDFVRPIIVATIFTWLAELILLLYYGIYLSEEGELLNKIIWTLGFCGLGMGLALGSIINLIVVGKNNVKTKIFYTIVLSTLVLGVACNALCMELDKHFKYFGGAENVYLHFLPSFFAAIIGGWFLGWLLFTPKGDKLLTKFGL